MPTLRTADGWQFLAHWLESSAKSQLRSKTFASYGPLTANHIVPAIGTIQLSKLTAQHVQELLNGVARKGLSPRTVQYVRAVLRRALNQALRWSYVSQNVVTLVDAPRVPTYQAVSFAVEDVPTLLKAFEAERLGILYLLALTHGLRQGEALGLRWEDIDFPTKEIRVRQALQWVNREPVFVEPKTKQSRRTFALSTDVAAKLKQHRKAQLQDRLLAGSSWEDHGLVFTTRTGRPLDGINVTRDFKRMLKQADLPVLRFHDLRHTAASFLLFQNVSPRVVMELLGHSGIRVTMDLYSHVAPVLQRDAANQMDALLRNAKAAQK